MAFRADIDINWALSPRLITVTSASEEVSLQDLGDTLRGLEHRPSINADVFSRPYIVDLSGKDDIGGGTSTGITLTQRDADLAFQRTDSRCSGSVTTGDPEGLVLIDSAATFQTDGVQRGDWVINFTDQSVTEVLSVDSEVQLTCRALSDGSDNQFGSGDLYKVWEVSECKLSGGNSLAIDSAGAAINPIFTSFGRYATRELASSATVSGLGVAALMVQELWQARGADSTNPCIIRQTNGVPTSIDVGDLEILISQPVAGGDVTMTRQ